VLLRTLALLSVVLAAASAGARQASAQNYPSRQIRLVVPFAAGGPADLLGRVIADEMSKDLGQQVFVDNRPGANTIIGAELAAKADPDGYTLLMAIDGTLVMNPFLYSKLSYDPSRISRRSR
jgi:tripartite-type tricarboxylate transporter receptor subunit TctC